MKWLSRNGSVLVVSLLLAVVAYVLTFAVIGRPVFSPINDIIFPFEGNAEMGVNFEFLTSFINIPIFEAKVPKAEIITLGNTDSFIYKITNSDGNGALYKVPGWGLVTYLANVGDTISLTRGSAYIDCRGDCTFRVQPTFFGWLLLFLPSTLIFIILVYTFRKPSVTSIST